MPLDTMKKLLLILSIFVVSLSAFAADLNPFAYGLRSSVNASNPMQLDIQFSINAPATSVKVYLYEIDGDWEVEVDAHLTVDNRAYEGWIDLSVVPGDLRGGVNNLNWRVDVNKGSARTKIELASNEVKLDFPSSVDIDNNPENENFGTVFVVEALPTGKGNSKFISKNEGAGLYIINADGTARPVPNRVGQYGYNGGRVEQTRQYFNGTSSSGFSPYRVRVSDDGRIFISSMTPDGEVLWEADPLVFSRPDAPDWETRAVAGWSHVMSSKNANTVMGAAKRNCSHTYCGIYHLYEGNAETGLFIAGPNMGFDVRGSGRDLKLLMLAGCKDAIVNFQSAHFYCDEYDLGEATMWNTPPSRRIFSGYVVNYAGVQVQYDGDGNVWLCQHRSNTDAETLMKFDVNNLGAPWKEDPKKPYHRCGAIRFNNDYTQVAIATVGSGSGGAFTVYPVVDGMPVWNQGTEVDCKSVTHHSLMDFAWDYAGNLYVAADEASGSAGDCVAIYATPYSGLKSTPAASGFAFEVNCASDESYEINVIAESNKGSATIAAGFDAEGKVPACTSVEVFAQSKDGYKFVCWKEGDVEVSRENPYTFSAVKDITLTAHFEAGDYTVTWWNLLANNYDITDDVIDIDRNKLLYDLFRPLYNTYHKVKDNPKNLRSQQKPAEFTNGDMNVIGFVYDECPGIMQDDQSPVKWIGDYLSYVAEQQGKVWNKEKYLAWGVHLFAFMNRSNTGRNSGGTDLKGYTVTGLNGYPDYTGEYGLPDKWRPWWTSIGCGLPNTMKYSSSMPSSFTQIQPTSGAIYTLNSNIVPQGTPTWYQWNTISDPNDEYILAWRDGSKTGRIVHNVYRDNMELHVSYVKKHLEENDPIVKQPDEAGYDPDDASNNDVLQLLRNPNFDAIPQHKLTMTRNITAGMYNTICLPFELTTLVGTPYDGAQILQINTTTTEDEVLKINFTPLTVSEATPMKAGVPYLIQKPTDVTGVQSFSSARFPEIQEYESNYKLNDHGGLSVDVGAITFHGVINPRDIPQGSIILVANNRLAEVTSNNEKMAGFRGYFTWNDPVRMPPAKMLISIGKQTPTAIEEITDPQPTEQPATSKVRKVMYNGQIYILRGEEVYTITGNRVK